MFSNTLLEAPVWPHFLPLTLHDPSERQSFWGAESFRHGLGVFVHAIGFVLPSPKIPEPGKK